MSGKKVFRPGDKGFSWVVAGVVLATFLVFGGAIAVIIAVVWKLFTLSVWWGIVGIVALLAARSIRVNQ